MGAVVALLLVVAAPQALRWVAPDVCPPEREVLEAVRANLSDRTRLETTALRAEVEVTRVAQRRFRMQLTLDEGSEPQRALESPACADLGRAAALIIALAIDQRAASEVAPVEEALAPAPQPQPQPPPPAPAAAQRVELPPAPAPAHRWAVHAALGGALGSLPGAAWGVAAGGAWLWRGFELELEGRYLAPRAAMSPARPGVGGQFELLTGALSGCHTVGFEALRACVGLELGALRSVGVGVEVQRDASLWAAPFAAVVGRWAVFAHFALRAGLELGAALWRPHFVVEGVAGDVFQPAPVTGRLTCGLEALLF
ncbi:MAG: hypothetical protein IPJ65_03600 [Archangiaceae bacterium]|nr:hypothetical protein [Archangiaceae bacterium]